MTPKDLMNRALRVSRRDTARKLLQIELDKLPPEEREIVERFVSRGRAARNIEREFEEQLTFGERVADQVAAFGGSWKFILIFVGFMSVWMAGNTLILRHRSFDPYPYILLNLVLSCLAALQAPIIMMSQNRAAEKDRLHALNDYQVNVKSELEIMQVHEKLNELREQDWAALLELQQQQLEMLKALADQHNLNDVRCLALSGNGAAGIIPQPQ